MAGKLTHNPRGTPLPDGHPLKGGCIILGWNRPPSSAKPSTPTPEPSSSLPGGGQQLRHRGPQIFVGVTSADVRSEYGTPVDGAESVLGIHYSREPRESLSGDFYGTGIKGAEARRVSLSPGATDMRAGIDRLSMTVQGLLALDPFSGHLFVFCNRKYDAIKVLYS